MTRLRTVSGQLSVIIVFLHPLVLCLLLAGCSGDADGGSGRANERLVPAVEAVQARYGSLPLT